MAADPLASLSALFLQTLSASNEERRAATNKLADAERTPGFTMTLLQLCGHDGFDLKMRLVAAATFKNAVKRNWNEPEAAIISTDDRATIKSHLVNLMTSVPSLVQRQLAEALTIISKRDFPGDWPSLLPDLVARLAVPDINTVVGVLETAHSIFERFRNAPNVDSVRKQVRQCIDAFGDPLLVTVTALAQRLEAGAAAREPRAALEPVATALRLGVGIFHSLSWLEVPDVFQERLPEWMTLMRNFLNCVCPSLAASSDDTEEGPLEALQATTLDLVATLAEKFDEDFEPFFPTFAGDVWGLLAGGGDAGAARMLSEVMDPLVTKAVKFLTASLSSAEHAEFFKSPEVLQSLCEKVVIPNIRLRHTDLEVFEDNAIEFIRRDIEGSDSDTRRRGAVDLVRGLLRHMEAQVSALLLTYIRSLLASYTTNRATMFLEKDAAIALIIALAAKTQVTSLGVTVMNPCVDLAEFLVPHILPELDAAAVDELPVVKAACIKFVSTFRAQFTREQLVALLGMVVPFAGARSFVVHTYAANAVEKALTVKKTVASATTHVTRSPVLAPADLEPHLPVLFTGLFYLMTKPDYPENDYMMKALMRVVAFSGAAVVPYAKQVIDGLTAVLARVCANPANPGFNHFMFETVAALMRNVCAARPESVADFEAMLFPPFQSVLSRDVMEFLPYVFQLMAALLELRPPPPPGAHSLTAGYESLLPPTLAAEVWLRPGNVPALTLLMQAYLRRGAAYLVATGNLVPLLGVWQNLLATKNQEEHSFEILEALFEGASFDMFGAYLGAVVDMLCKKLTASKSAKLATLFTHAACVLAGFHGGAALQAALDGLSPGLFLQILEHVMLPHIAATAGRERRAEVAVGLARLVQDVPALLRDAAQAALAGRVIACIVELLEQQHGAGAQLGEAVGGSTNPDAFFAEEKDTSDLVEEAVGSEYTAAFSRLHFAAERGRYAFRAVAPDAKAFVGRAIAAASAAAPGRIAAVVSSGPVAATVVRYVAAVGAAIA